MSCFWRTQGVKTHNELLALEPLISGTFQALQSYQFNDIVIGPNVQFAQCVTMDRPTEDGAKRKFVVDLDLFHKTVQKSSDGENEVSFHYSDNLTSLVEKDRKEESQHDEEKGTANVRRRSSWF